MSKGFICLVLHAHLPYIRYPEYENFLEEEWFYEAQIETYIPLLNVFKKLESSSINFKLTMSISPSLCEMFADELLQSRFLKRLNKLRNLAKSELLRTKDTPFYQTALMYHQKLEQTQ